jgi:hypothetical protein
MHSGAKATIIAFYLPQTPVVHSQTCKALSRLKKTLIHHTIILGEEFQGRRTCPIAKGANIRKLPCHRWEGPTTPTFLLPSRHDQATYIDHLAIWNLHALTTQIGPTQTFATSFLDQSGGLGRTLLPLLILPAYPFLTTAKTPRVPMFKYQIPSHTLAAWKS